MKFNFFCYKKLRKTFQFEVLRLMKDSLGSSFTSTQHASYDRLQEGFYVYAPGTKDDQQETSSENISKNIKGVIDYFLRYTGRTPMAVSRIDNYDSKNQTVDWWYIDHQSKKRVDVHDSSLRFLAKLLMHCPDENFKSVRYYGFYANACKHILNRIHELTNNQAKITKEKERKLKLQEKTNLNIAQCSLTHLIGTH